MTSAISYYTGRALSGGVTPTQAKVLAAIDVLGAKFKRPPTYDELCRKLRLTSRGGIHEHVTILRAKGFLAPAQKFAGGQLIRTRRCPVCGRDPRKTHR